MSEQKSLGRIVYDKISELGCKATGASLSDVIPFKEQKAEIIAIMEALETAVLAEDARRHPEKALAGELEKALREVCGNSGAICTMREAGLACRCQYCCRERAGSLLWRLDDARKEIAPAELDPAEWERFLAAGEKAWAGWKEGDEI